ncbi:hypothetical protein DESA109040_18805 [Deinococcus saxicola]
MPSFSQTLYTLIDRAVRKIEGKMAPEVVRDRAAFAPASSSMSGGFWLHTPPCERGLDAALGRTFVRIHQGHAGELGRPVASTRGSVRTVYLTRIGVHRGGSRSMFGARLACRQQTDTLVLSGATGGIQRGHVARLVVICRTTLWFYQGQPGGCRGGIWRCDCPFCCAVGGSLSRRVAAKSGGVPSPE